MKRILPALVAISLLAAPAVANAKEVTSATVCGSSGCKDSSHPAALLPILMGGGPPYAGQPARARPFYRLRVVVGEGTTSEPMRLIVVPQGRYVRGPDGAWSQTSAATLRKMQRLAAGVHPLPASQLPGVSDSPPRSHPDTAAREPSPAPAEQSGTLPWLTVAAIGAGLVLVGALALGLRRSRGHAIRTRTIGGASGR